MVKHACQKWLKAVKYKGEKLQHFNALRTKKKLGPT